MAKLKEPELDLGHIETRPPQPKYRQLEGHIWTKNKALLIQRYLTYFVMVTKHGTYLDAFAGPQSFGGRHANWAAKLVLESKPQWLRNFRLFELNPHSAQALRSLRDSLPRVKGRRIRVFEGDTNVLLPRFLDSEQIMSKEATFCLLDQRTMECDWATVEKLAKHKKGGHKIELFYFLAEGWFARAFSAVKDKEAKMARFWAREDWQEMVKLSGWNRCQVFRERFENELGYKHVTGYPILKYGGNGRAMFYMIHATDHPQATGLMMRAYSKGGASAEDTQEEMTHLLERAKGSEKGALAIAVAEGQSLLSDSND